MVFGIDALAGTFKNVTGRSLSRRRFTGVVVGSLTATLLSACGGDDETTTPTSGTSAQPQTASGGSTPASAATGAASPASGTPGTGATGEKPVKGGTLIYARNLDAKTLDPHFSSQFSERFILYCIYDTIVGWDTNFEIIPALAESWEVSGDGMKITFKTRANAKFHDGTACDAAAVKWNIERILNPETKSNQISQLEPAIASVEAPDTTTVVMNLKLPWRPLFSALGERAGFVVSPTAAQKDPEGFARNPVGSGPFKFVEWVSDSRIVIERNPDYWNQEQPYLDKIEYRHVPESQVRVTQIRTGEAHLVDEVDATIADTLRGAQGVVVETYNGQRWYALQQDFDKPPFNDRNLRQAIAYAIDREAIKKVVFGNTGRPGTQPLAGGWAYDPSLNNAFKFDLNKAKELLAQANVSGQPYSLHFSNTQLYSDLAQLIQSQLEALGLKIELKPENPADTFKLVKEDKINWVLTNWTPRADPDGLLRILYHSKGFQNDTTYNNPEVDRLLDQAAGVYDTEEATRLYHQAEKLIVEDASYIFLHFTEERAARREEVQGFTFYPDLVHRLRYVWLKK